MTSLCEFRCPECGGDVDRDHCVEPGRRVGQIGCGWWKLAEGPHSQIDEDAIAEHFVTPDCVECVMTWLLLGDGSACLRCGCRLTWKGSK